MEHSHQSYGREEEEEEEQQGTMSIVTTTVTVSIGDPWDVQYARFFNFPSRCAASATAGTRHPSLVPLAKKTKGSWISSFTSLACLRLLTTTAGHSIILTVTLVDNVIEEHYISKLHFTWPQVSCLTGYSPRGSKVVFMSYKDQVGQIQKFAVRFLTTDETERFINFVKEAFGHERINGSTSGISKSKTSCESAIIPSFEAENRPTQDWDLITTSAEFSEPMYRPIQDFGPNTASAGTYYQPFYPIENHDGSINSSHLSQDFQGKLSAFPPSFTSLLMGCSPVTELALQPSDPEEVTLKKDIMKYLEDSSFQEMLCKVQKVVNEFGDDLLLLPSCRPQQYQ